MAHVETKPQTGSRAFVAPGKILVATDLTDLDYLIPHAKAQCEASEASLVLCHVIQPVDSSSLEAAVVFIADAARAATQRLLEESRKTLGEVAAMMRVDGIDCPGCDSTWSSWWCPCRNSSPHVHAGRVASGYAWST